MNDRELSLRSEDLAGSVHLDQAGNPTVELSPSVIRAYSGNTALYAIRKPGGAVIAASSPDFADRVRGWPAADEESELFSADRLRWNGRLLWSEYRARQYGRPALDHSSTGRRGE